MTAGPCVSLAKIRQNPEKPSSAPRLAVRGDASLVLQGSEEKITGAVDVDRTAPRVFPRLRRPARVPDGCQVNGVTGCYWVVTMRGVRRRTGVRRR
jgi:hypothetical protein